MIKLLYYSNLSISPIKKIELSWLRALRVEIELIMAWNNEKFILSVKNLKQF